MVSQADNRIVVSVCVARCGEDLVKQNRRIRTASELKQLQILGRVSVIHAAKDIQVRVHSDADAAGGEGTIIEDNRAGQSDRVKRDKIQMAKVRLCPESISCAEG